MVDVRDVAWAHIQAINLDSMKYHNGRYILAAESLWFKDIIAYIKAEEKVLGKKIKTKIISNWVLKLASMFNPELKYLMPFVD